MVTRVPTGSGMTRVRADITTEKQSDVLSRWRRQP